MARLALLLGTGVGDMFNLMEISEGEWADALYYLDMACRAYGVGPADSTGANIEIPKSKLCRGIDPSPCCDDFIDFYCLASDVVEVEARQPDDDPDPQAPVRCGDRVWADFRLPSGNRATGNGTVVRWIAKGDRLSACEGAVVAGGDQIGWLLSEHEISVCRRAFGSGRGTAKSASKGSPDKDL